MNGQIVVQRLLNEKLTEARFQNPSYSLRAFSRRLGIGSAALSEILNGKRNVSHRLVSRIVTRLSLAPEQASQLLEMFSRDRRAWAREAASSDDGLTRVPLQLSADQFNTISEWYHLAILSLLETNRARHEVAWIAKRLRISNREVSGALERLERLGLLRRDGKRILITGKSLVTTDEVVNLSLQRSHAKNLELARRSLEEDPISERDFTAITMAADPARLESAKKMIRRFRDQLCAHLEQGDKREVYKLCMQLIPLTRKETES